MNLPNKLTIFRILLVPIMLILSFCNFQGEPIIMCVPLNVWLVNILFIIASLTDKLDGYLARKNNQVTDFGKFLDPIADKIVVISAMIILVGMQKLPTWIPIIVIFREFLVSGYRLIAVQKNGKVIAANVWGKIKTATQMISIILLFMDSYYYGACFTKDITNTFSLILNIIATLLMTISVIATIFSGYEYLKGGKEFFKNSK